MHRITVLPGYIRKREKYKAPQYCRIEPVRLARASKVYGGAEEMGKGRRLSGGGGGGRNLRMLRQHVESLRKKYSDAGDIVHHLRELPPYRRMEQRALTRLVDQILCAPSRGQVHRLKEKEHEEDEEDSRVNRSQARKRQNQIDESEERLLRIENMYTRRIDRNPLQASSDSGSSSSPPSSSAVSTSEDAVYEVKVEPEFDLMQSMLRDSYAPPAESKEEKNVELEVASAAKGVDKIDMTKGGKRLGAPAVSRKGASAAQVSNAIVEEVKGKDGPWFRDLGGMAAVLEELVEEVLVPLCHPHVVRRLGVNPISGVLLHGPPGCGKTKLAHALANETGIPFYKISATEVVSGVSGVSEENIRDLFSKAHRTAPSIIFIDEIDAIASKRENLQREMERRIVTQLMTCMDEFYKLAQPSHANSDPESLDQRIGYVLVIGATNRPDAIDPALRRPGRFDREIKFGVPDENARKEILSVLTQNCTLEGSIDISHIARSTPGFVGADLAALVNKAGNVAMRRILAQRKSVLCGENKDKELQEEWYKIPWLPEEIEKLAITMADFEEAAKLVQPSSKREGFSAIPNVRWEDVGGLDYIRRELDLHIVGRIKHPEYYEQFGLKLETGILLYGPPGCGKTLIAKAVANEAGANFIYIKGPEILDKYVGESELAVRTLFSRARTCSPCILFFDEVDALTTKRGREGGWVVERLLNQLLTELDGADQRMGIFVVGATNRPEVMDPAVLRPGRFGKLLYVPLPSPDDRGLILKALAKSKPIDPSVDLNVIGQLKACENFSGADLMKLVCLYSCLLSNVNTKWTLRVAKLLVPKCHSVFAHDVNIFAFQMEESATAALEEFRSKMGWDKTPPTIKTSHFEQALCKVSPSVSHKQIQYYKAWLETFKAS